MLVHFWECIVGRTHINGKVGADKFRGGVRVVALFAGGAGAGAGGVRIASISNEIVHWYVLEGTV